MEKKKSYHGGNPRIENVTSNEEREGPQRRQRRLRLTGGPGMTKGKRSKTWEEVKDLGSAKPGPKGPTMAREEQVAGSRHRVHYFRSLET